MISRSLLQSLPIRNTLARSKPQLLPVKAAQCICKIPISSHPYIPPSPGYQQRRHKYYRFDPDEVRNARPLLSDEDIKNFSRHPAPRSFIALLTAGGVFVYFSNLEDVPVSGRRRFNIYSHQDMEREGQVMYEHILRQYKGAILPDWDNRTRMVQRVMSRLIPASGIDNVNWEVNVIESNEMNAFVIPGGKVFVFTGILPIARTDDGLATILGHEIAHNLANHSGESMSKTAVFYVPLRILLNFLDGTGYTGGLALVFGGLLLEYGMKLPASRSQEKEADHIGLMVMAKGCYNPQAAVGVWERMQAAEKNAPPEWLSTHPSRITQMQELMPTAEAARDESGCAPTMNSFNNFRNTYVSEELNRIKSTSSRKPGRPPGVDLEPHKDRLTFHYNLNLSDDQIAQALVSEGFEIKGANLGRLRQKLGMRRRSRYSEFREYSEGPAVLNNSSPKPPSTTTSKPKNTKPEMAQNAGLVTQVTAFVEKYMSAYDGSHDFNHIRRVVGLAHGIYKELGEDIMYESGLDLQVITLAALLHDVGDKKYLLPGQDSNTLVLSTLLGFGAEEKLAIKVQRIVLGVSYSSEIKDVGLVQNLIEKYPELAVVQDADRLDAIGAVGIGRTFTFGGAKGAKNMEETIQHFEDKLEKLSGMMKTAPGKRMAEERTKRLATFKDWWKEEQREAEGLLRPQS
ncbi:hypothetical protein DSL72_006588 [Monilinia vaccinii-corymbosi]|uniref:Peptidase M48 domain-containing protein n=1 Tax=Monilinia vaccinii-corymbosi TaxID=61207 RepID=A0A8A3PP62_9HELO|nr:hypothetical protein DSL72_006588 [Monilinia vaccinii-corymbosi]